MQKQCEHRKSCDLIFKRSTRQSPGRKPCESCPLKDVSPFSSKSDKNPAFLQKAIVK